MRVSELMRALDDEFGALGIVRFEEQVMRELGSRTAKEAIEAGVSAKTVWVALCEANEVSPERIYGAGLLDPE